MLKLNPSSKHSSKDSLCQFFCALMPFPIWSILVLASTLLHCQGLSVLTSVSVLYCVSVLSPGFKKFGWICFSDRNGMEYIYGPVDFPNTRVPGSYKCGCVHPVQVEDLLERWCAVDQQVTLSA